MMNKLLGIVALLVSFNVMASQDAPDDLYAMQCVDGTCYYATGKQIPENVLKKFEQEMAAEMAKIEQEQGEQSSE
ncbi:hypothetical protein pEaSNUABM37_00350 [Erwinia phage pEa_SNUABM_37]|nr:hypothetical protein pEaSNUABM37_00350 [Erwinia phage pEa_SNUABM_37]QXO10818.1 hypothetical protein pEaSNUABM48_00350 [Erwinia phage pEa_SNUABM_48]